ncbi:DUF4129 domain-containing protein [Flavobacterium sp. FBOR7N2.3]|uniref:DUF4129 domain-containing protein n=1 Tax=Flavobacterium magnesitis TaxID=3138077 RepID=A0ABV4TFG3_9FLAO
MNKYLIIIFFLLFLNLSQAQDSLAVAQDTVATKWNQKDILVDSSAIEKRAFAKNYQQKYKDSDFVYERQAAEINAWERFKQWLITQILNLFRLGDPKTAITILKVLAGIVILVVIYLITKALINKEGQWIFGANSNKKKINYNDIEKNIHLVDFEKLIQESLKEDRKRLCIRYYYLWLLKVMAENRLIEWHVDKTNSDYLYELQSKPLKEEFTYLSYLYNYIWYGEFDMDEKSFQNAQNRFKNALKSFGNE